ncbi:hypothetical protein PENCOP_c015G00163 [Penicillium coprophilum]|uniref:Reverse transcriptase zinc-binding domain-containing protein n=1 Tax=Penicillium coprophilum TaxID=36646 RepID=A0A1V6U8K5_9EURO|nr:hypothetical protein PENCOP_c015G00163 [Penicillium coprophilum]
MRLWINTQKKQPKNRTAHRTLSSVVYASQPQRNGEVAENLEWDRTWAKETTSRPTRRLIEAPTKSTLEYWSGLRKATTSNLMQLRTGRIGLGAYLNRINRRETARCGCDLGNQPVIHVLLECPLHQDERDWMRSAVSDKKIALSRDELLTRPGARTVVAEIMVKAPPARPISDSRPCGSGRGRGRQRSGDNLTNAISHTLQREILIRRKLLGLEKCNSFERSLLCSPILGRLRMLKSKLNSGLSGEYILRHRVV